MEVALHEGRWQALYKQLGAGSRGGQTGAKVAFDVNIPFPTNAAQFDIYRSSGICIESG